MPDEIQSPDVLPLGAEGPHSYAAWTQRIEAAAAKRDTKTPDWNEHIDDYLVTLKAAPKADTVVVPKHFSLVEQKKPKLFFQTPDVFLKPKRDDYREAALLFQPVMNRYLGRYGVHAKACMNEVTSDVLFTGLMVSKIGYENVVDGTKPVVVGQQPAAVQPPPVAQPGAVLGLGAPAPPPVMEPIVEMVPNVIWERYFWERVSPAKALVPETFHGSDYDKAAWLGFEFLIDKATGIRAYKLPADFSKGSPQDEHRLGPEKSLDLQEDQIRGWEVWYRAAQFDPTVKHPDLLRQLVLIEGLDQPVVHRDSPYQRQTPEGKLIGMRGFPVHIGALRYVSDCAYPPADCHTTKNLVGELSKFRSTMILQRDRSIPMRAADSTRLTPEAKAAIEKGDWQSVLMLDGPPEGVLAEIARANYPRENYTANDYCDRDISEAWALGPNQRGMDNEEAKTATELTLAQNSSNERMANEQAAVLTYFAAGAEKLGALIQLFADDEDYVEIEGPDGTKRLAAWDKRKIAGDFLYEVKPNGAQKVDAADTQRRWIQLYNFIAKDPAVNRVEVLKQLLQAFELDPTKVLAQPKPKEPDPPSLGFSFKGEDLNPTLAQFPLVVDILRQGGVKITPEALQLVAAQAQAQSQIMGAGGVPTAGPAGTGPAQPREGSMTHGGMADQTEMLNKHQEERTGAMKGTGAQM